MSNSLTFNGHNSKEYGVMLSGSGTFNAPEADVTTVQIPGRDGNLLLDNHRWQNIRIEYPAYVHRDFQTHAPDIRAWLCGSPVASYIKLTDDYDTAHFRMARFVGPLEFSPRTLNTSAEFVMVFEAKPQRWLNSGDTEQSVTRGGTMSNPTNFPSRPLIHVTGAASGAQLTVNGKVIAFTAAVSNGYIDCDTMEAYYGSSNLNSRISCDDFPYLSPGSNTISWTGTISSVKIKPRWWTL